MRVFSIFVPISEGVFKPHFKKSREEVQAECTIPQGGSHSSSSGCRKTPAEAAARGNQPLRSVYAAVRSADADSGRGRRAGTDRRMGRVRRDAAAGGRRRLCAGGRRLLCSGGGHHRAVPSGLRNRENQKKTGRTSPLDTNRRRKANEENEYSVSCSALHGGVYAPTVAFAAGTGKAIQLGTSGISGYDTAKVGTGYDYIYMGSYNSSPVKWRVLDDQTNTGATGLFLLSEDLAGVAEMYISMAQARIATHGRAVTRRRGAIHLKAAISIAWNSLQSLQQRKATRFIKHRWHIIAPHQYSAQLTKCFSCPQKKR